MESYNTETQDFATGERNLWFPDYSFIFGVYYHIVIDRSYTKSDPWNLKELLIISGFSAPDCWTGWFLEAWMILPKDYKDSLCEYMAKLSNLENHE